jgi:hypothetical protein
MEMKQLIISSYLLLCFETACGISTKVATGMVRNWKSQKLQKYRQFIHGQRQAKDFLKRPSVKRAGELLNFSRNQLRIMSALQTGNCHFKGHLLKLGMVDSSGCDKCHQALETVPHFLCDCKALVVLRFRHLSHHFLQPDNSANMSASKTLHFVQSEELLNA